MDFYLSDSRSKGDNNQPNAEQYSTYKVLQLMEKIFNRSGLPTVLQLALNVECMYIIIVYLARVVEVKTTTK